MSPLRLTALTVSAMLLAGVSARPSQAQRALIIGAVRDTSGARIPYAEAVLVSAKRQDRASDRGWFVLDSLEAGADLLIVRAIGYQVQRLPVTLGATDALELEVVLSPQVQVLPEVIVKAYGRELTGVAASAAQRMLRNGAPASGLITREDIETWGKFDLANVFRRAGLRIIGDIALCAERGVRKRVSVHTYDMTVYLDGSPIYLIPTEDGPGVSVRRIPPEQIEAIEVYRSIATRPVEFDATGATGCLVLIWTRR